MFEAGKYLVGESHNKESNPTEDLGMTVGIDFVDGKSIESSGGGDSQKQEDAPGHAQCQHDEMPAVKNGR